MGFKIRSEIYVRDKQLLKERLQACEINQAEYQNLLGDLKRKSKQCSPSTKLDKHVADKQGYISLDTNLDTLKPKI